MTDRNIIRRLLWYFALLMVLWAGIDLFALLAIDWDHQRTVVFLAESYAAIAALIVRGWIKK